ncbi:unnamed protein product [Parnassius apollo]|uniref:Regulatory protein zeste n=1 Tax=Parnassius apollo TaxID=110799 RepID=A0A8S3XDV1_PARAO|nr:unnamed protein product [Parnassius apollo]
MTENNRKRCQNFAFDEKDNLIKLRDTFKNVILNKKSDGIINQATNEAWVNLCTRLNSTGTTARSKESLLRVWEKMKTDAKLYKALSKSSHNATGMAHHTLRQILFFNDLMGRACAGITGVQDLDAD